MDLARRFGDGRTDRVPTAELFLEADDEEEDESLGAFGTSSGALEVVHLIPAPTAEDETVHGVRMPVDAKMRKRVCKSP